MGKELWKVIPDFEFYLISNTGKVMRQERKVKNRVLEQKMLIGSDNGYGYKKIVLKQDGRSRRAYIHRLVAEAFIENPENKPFINHIDCDPSNNHVSNLEWCTHKENVEWMNKQGRAKRTAEWLENLHKSQTQTYKSVIGKNLETGEEIRFPNLNSVKEMGFQPSCVCCCCKGSRNATQHKGYSWRYG